MDGIVQMVEEGQRKHVPKESICAHFNWVTIDQAGMNFKGRFVPDIEYDEERFIANLSKVTQHSFEEWLRETTTLSVNTEINVQLGEFTVKKNITKPLEVYIYTYLYVYVFIYIYVYIHIYNRYICEKNITKLVEVYI
jgi:hypothetical protein